MLITTININDASIRNFEQFNEFNVENNNHSLIIYRNELDNNQIDAIERFIRNIQQNNSGIVYILFENGHGQKARLSNFAPDHHNNYTFTIEIANNQN